MSGKAPYYFLLSGSIDKIILIDTNPQALSMAAENLFLNNMARDAIFVPAFVSNKLGESIQFWTLGTGAAGSMYESHAVSAKKAGASFAVDTVTLDNLAEYYNLFPDFAKIDVEGAEALVLEGAIRVSETGCKFLVEMHSNPELSMETNASKVLAWCEKNSYHAWYLKNHSLLKSPETIKHRGRCHLLLLPVNLPFPSYLEGVEQGSALQERIS
jgi:FkbM family methyltransferase